MDQGDIFETYGLDPTKNYPIRWGQTMQGSKQPLIHVEPGFKPLDGLKSLKIKASSEKKDEFSLEAQGRGRTSATASRLQSRYILLFNEKAKEFTLERIGTEVNFGLEMKDVSFDSDALSDEEALNPAGDENGAPDPDNPFDWRHQIKRPRTPSPDIEPMSLDAVATPSPDGRLLNRKIGRRASTPPSAAADESEIEIDTRKQDQQGSQFDFEFENSDAEPDQPADGEDSDSSGDGGLEIVLDGAKETRPLRGRFPERRPDGEPRSLISTASSQSPAMRERPSLHYEEDEGDPREGAEEEMEEEAVPSDEDVAEIKLGSPIHERPKAVALERNSSSPVAADEIEEDIDDFEAEYEKALEDEEEDRQPQQQAYESSSESEEE